LITVLLGPVIFLRCSEGCDPTVLVLSDGGKNWIGLIQAPELTAKYRRSIQVTILDNFCRFHLRILQVKYALNFMEILGSLALRIRFFFWNKTSLLHDEQLASMNHVNNIAYSGQPHLYLDR